MITQLCSPQFITHVSISLGARPHFLPGEPSADCFRGEEAERPVGHCWGSKARSYGLSALGNARPSSALGRGSVLYLFTRFLIFLLTFQGFLFAGLRTILFMSL